MTLTFEWDEEKAEENLRKHAVSFDESRSVFGDLLSLTVKDHLHSDGERRYVVIGRSESDRLLVVCYTERSSNIRLISSRRATRAERKTYEEGVG